MRPITLLDGELLRPPAVCDAMEQARKAGKAVSNVQRGSAVTLGRSAKRSAEPSAILSRPAGSTAEVANSRLAVVKPAGVPERTAPRLVANNDSRSEPQLKARLSDQEEEPRTMSEPTVRQIDQQLVERAQRGDKKAFELLVTKYQRKLARLLSRFVRDPAEVEDVTQEAFIKAYRALPSFRGDSAFYTWLYRIGINTAKNYLVALGRRAPTTTEFDAEEAESFDDADNLRDNNTPDAMLQSKEIGEAVNRAMEALPEEVRTAITLREIAGLSYEDIANVMACPIGTVRSRIFRARDEIAAELRPLLDTNDDRRW